YMRTLLLTLTAAGACALAAVSASDAPQFAGSAPVKLTLPALPDSAMKADNPFKKEKLLSSLPPLTPLRARQMMADYTTMVPDTAGRFELAVPSDASQLSLRRFATRIRPSGFYKGKIKVSTEASAGIYIDGEEVASKTTFDTVPGDVEGTISLEPGRDAIVEVRTLTDITAVHPTLKVEFTPDDDSKEVQLTSHPTLKTLFNINTISEGRRLADVELSPDGSHMILTYSYSANSVDFDESCMVAETAGGRIVTENITSGAEWMSGENARLQYSRSNGDGTFDIITTDYPSQHQSVLARNIPEDVRPYTLSPKGDYIVYYVKEKGAEDNTGVMHRIQSPDDRQPGNRDRFYLTMMRLDDHVARPLTYGGNSTYLCDISADGSKILYSASRETPEKFPFYEANLVQVDINTLRTDTVPGIDASLKSAIYSPDGGKIFITAGPNAFGGVGLNAGAYDWGNDFDMQGYLYDIKTRGIKPLTRDFDPSITDARWNNADGLIYLKAEEGFDQTLYTLNPVNGKITKLPTEVDFVRTYSIATRKANYAAYTGMSYTYMGRGYLLNLKTNKNTLIDDPMADTLAGINFGDWKQWSFTAPDGTTVDGTVTLPPDFDPGKKYPFIVYYYGGTAPSNHVNYHPYTPQLMASRGYVVYVLNPSGTTGYGQEFSARHVNAWGDYTADEIIYGVKEFCKVHPFVNEKKIGCLGASYGGFMTQLLQTKTDIFAAAVSHAGISDITSYWGEGYWGYSYNSVAAARSYPWNNPKLFTEHSPLFNADKIHTPLLLLHGTVDTNVPIGESIQLYNALKILDREVEFITVEGANHVVVDFAKRKEWHATIMAWFEKWLKDDPRWWDEIYKK
ncbi:MAG: prolyl oligopeptidase family serine peptidase, partial [Muribaculaceae bacterium]|nr:prolyl oligopeptidase family serine peptidase [Muribaculaceae bacterium]